MHQLAHHGPDDDHRRFTAGGEAGFEGLAPVCSCDCDHRWYVKSLSEEGIAHLGNSRLSADAAAGFMLTRIEARVSRRLLGAAEAFSAEEREQDRDGFHAEAGAAVQQLPLFFQMRRASFLSVLVLLRAAEPNALIWAGLTTLTARPFSARNAASASQ